MPFDIKFAKINRNTNMCWRYASMNIHVKFILGRMKKRTQTCEHIENSSCTAGLMDVVFVSVRSWRMPTRYFHAPSGSPVVDERGDAIYPRLVEYIILCHIYISTERTKVKTHLYDILHDYPHDLVAVGIKIISERISECSEALRIYSCLRSFARPT